MINLAIVVTFTINAQGWGVMSVEFPGCDFASGNASYSCALRSRAAFVPVRSRPRIDRILLQLVWLSCGPDLVKGTDLGRAALAGPCASRYKKMQHKSWITTMLELGLTLFKLPWSGKHLYCALVKCKKNITKSLELQFLGVCLRSTYYVCSTLIPYPAELASLIDLLGNA